MSESGSFPMIAGSHIDEEQQQPAEPRETLKQRAIRYVKVLGDFVRLFFGLLLDERVSPKVKLFVASVLAYIFAPLDFIPEMFTGLFGMLDDFVLSAFAINVILNWIDPAIVRSHWRGNQDLLDTVQKAIKNSEILVPEAIVKKIQAWVGKRSGAQIVAVQPAPVEPPAPIIVEPPGAPKRKRRSKE